MKALDKIRSAKALLEKAEIQDSFREAELIISHCLGIERTVLYKDNPHIPEDTIIQIDKFLERRMKREPLQYILGYIEFYGIKIKVGPGVLIPRPETELLVEETIKLISNSEIQNLKFRILDLCTGSGCLALSLAKQFPDALVYGSDTSVNAIKYAKENAKLNKIKNVIFSKGSLFEPFKGLKFDLIVSNPPYIKRGDIKDLQPEIKEWEPLDALDGGEDGLNYYRMIISEANRYLKKGGYLMLELGINQANKVKKIVLVNGLKEIKIKRDYAGIDRILVAKMASHK